MVQEVCKLPEVGVKPGRIVGSFQHATAESPPHTEQVDAMSGPTGVFAERHYTIAEIASMWKLSKDAVRRLFQKEQGVLALGNSHSRVKRRYTTLRIPQSVLERVHLKYSLSRQYLTR